ncbi:MAG: NADP-dependent oxidoreductase [Bacteroidales bacterium]|nr:NADP-dependent oxidoreductase [Bacteroidales bacterium]
MKAIRIHQFGSSELLKTEEVPVPVISDNELLISVYTASVNHIDSLLASGFLSHVYPLVFPWIPGTDFAGKIEAIGKNVSNFAVGDAVYGSKFGGGAYAEFMVVTLEMIYAKPASLTFVEAAGLPVAAVTAIEGLFKHGHLQSGQKVLIHGGAGAVGTCAVQMAVQAGARVIVTASETDKNWLLSLGAHEVIDYRTKRFESVAGEVDMVFDLVGGEVQDRSFTIIREGGFLVAVNQHPSAELAKKYNVRTVFMNALPRAESLKQVYHLIEKGKLSLEVAQVYPLEEAGQAWKNIAENLTGTTGYRPVNKDKKRGKHVILIRK